jgi:hypothetical protein
MDTEVGKQGSVSKTKVPRLYHTKSRNGCQRCRARRVKVSFFLDTYVMFVLRTSQSLQFRHLVRT